MLNCTVTPRGITMYTCVFSFTLPRNRAKIAINVARPTLTFLNGSASQTFTCTGHES